MTNEKNEFGLVAKERGYSDNFVKALSKLEVQQGNIDIKEKEKQSRIMEITDFVERSFNPHMINFIRDIHRSSSYFDRATKFMEIYYPSDYIDREDFHHIMKRYGVRDNSKWVHNDFIIILICIVYTVCMSISFYSLNGGLDGGQYALLTLLAFVLSILATFITVVVVGWVFVLYDRINFAISNR